MAEFNSNNDHGYLFSEISALGSIPFEREERLPGQSSTQTSRKTSLMYIVSLTYNVCIYVSVIVTHMVVNELMFAHKPACCGQLKLVC